MEKQENQTREENKLILSLTQTAGWRILADRWDRQCRIKETELHNLLRRHDVTLDKVRYAQGILDGIDLLLRQVESTTNPE